VVGYAGSDGYAITVVKNGQNVDPLTIFYQSTSTTGVPFEPLTTGGVLDQTKIDNLRSQLAAAINKNTGVYDKWHKSPVNKGITWECAWYAYGRGMQYLESQGYPIGSLPASFGNGGDYYSYASPYFVCDSTPSANSWIVWSPDPGSKYGHVAYVEDVVACSDGSYDLVISEAWQGRETPNVKTVNTKNINTYTSSRYGTYHLAGYVHLDQPKS
jgi:surface antigen